MFVEREFRERNSPRRRLGLQARSRVPIEANSMLAAAIIHLEAGPAIPDSANCRRRLKLAGERVSAETSTCTYLGCPPARQLTITFVLRIALVLLGGSMKYGATFGARAGQVNSPKVRDFCMRSASSGGAELARLTVDQEARRVIGRREGVRGNTG